MLPCKQAMLSGDRQKRKTTRSWSAKQSRTLVPVKKCAGCRVLNLGLPAWCQRWRCFALLWPEFVVLKRVVEGKCCQAACFPAGLLVQTWAVVLYCASPSWRMTYSPKQLPVLGPWCWLLWQCVLPWVRHCLCNAKSTDPSPLVGGEEDDQYGGRRPWNKYRKVRHPGSDEQVKVPEGKLCMICFSTFRALGLNYVVWCVLQRDRQWQQQAYQLHKLYERMD